ncbi:MAG: hypothetical protein MJA28_06125 [Gammaproteobacteria bacterium]|nr:hypothetical protein [Gammaproteobacteria bacterium]
MLHVLEWLNNMNCGNWMGPEELTAQNATILFTISIIRGNIEVRRELKRGAFVQCV